jgi:hypothetical protein
MTQKEKVKEWLNKHEIDGSKAWWDDDIYYSLTVEQIIRIANSLKKTDTQK